MHAHLTSNDSEYVAELLKIIINKNLAIANRSRAAAYTIR